MTHRFLVEAGRWALEGQWLERGALPITVKGATVVAWSQDDWFSLASKLLFPKGERAQITIQCRGHLNRATNYYTYIVEQNWLGKAEGEGWITPQSVIQRYWVLEDRQRRTGFESFYRLDDNTYHLSSVVVAGHHLTDLMEATLIRQP